MDTGEPIDTPRTPIDQQPTEDLDENNPGTKRLDFDFDDEFFGDRMWPDERYIPGYGYSED